MEQFGLARHGWHRQTIGPLKQRICQLEDFVHLYGTCLNTCSRQT